jgi:hypothetical protein
MRFWERLRSPNLAPQERLFFEVYGQALRGRPWALPLLDGIVETWVGPVAAMLEAGAGVSRETARVIARLQVAVGRGLLLDVLATGDDQEVDAAMRYFQEMLAARLAVGTAGMISDRPASHGPLGAGRRTLLSALYVSEAPDTGGLRGHLLAVDRADGATRPEVDAAARDGRSRRRGGAEGERP